MTMIRSTHWELGDKNNVSSLVQVMVCHLFVVMMFTSERVMSEIIGKCAHKSEQMNKQNWHIHHLLSGKLWYLQLICVGDTIVYH